MKFKPAYKQLNEDQKKAVDSLQGPVLVVAGPGTGKTQILALRIANILKKTDTKPQNILAMTFTETATYNMRQRLIEFIGSDAYKVKISTFHSFCNEVIQTFPEKFAFHNNLTQLDELDKYKIIQQLLDNHDPSKTYKKFSKYFKDKNIQKDLKNSNKKILKPFYAPFYYQKDIVHLISTLKREYINIEKFENMIIQTIKVFNELKKINPRTNKPYGKWSKAYKDISKNIELLNLYKLYEKNLKEKGKYDFTDMISFVTDKLKTDDELLAYYQEQYLYILVDEYQDTNGAQNEVIKTLGSWDDYPNIFVVGDDDQSIYRFQGANLENILEFKQTYPRSKVITIHTNYRSNQQIIDFASSLIKKNSQRLTNKIKKLDKNLTSGRQTDNQEAIVLSKFSRNEIEYFAICEKIKSLIKKGTDPNEIAIIYRKHSDGEEILDFLLRSDIPVNLIAKSNILEEEIIVQLIKLFKAIDNPNINDHLIDILLFNFLELNRLDVFKLYRFVGYNKKIRNKTLFDCMLDENLLQEAGIQHSKEIKKLAEKMLEWKQADQNLSFVQFFDLVINESNLLKFIKSTKNLDDLNSLKTIFDFIKTRTREKKDYKMPNFLKDCDVLEEANIKLEKETFKSQDKGVNMLTAHAAKGLEFEHIFIPKVIEKTWSNMRVINKIKLINTNLNHKSTENIEKPDLIELLPGIDKKEKLEEERRLFYVALTRAKNKIFLSFSEEYNKDQRTSQATPSQFLEELDKNLIHKTDTQDLENTIEDVLLLEFNTPTKLNLDKKERIYLKEILKDFKLSVTALNNYLEDPQKFLYNNLLRMPKVKTKGQALGTAVHSALEFFFRNYMRSSKQNSNKILDKSILLEFFKKTLQKEFLGHEEFEETLSEGNDILSNWYDYYKDDFVIPVALEYSFYGSGVYLGDIPLIAKIDKIEWIDKTSKQVKVIDYKTSKPKTKGVITKPIDGDEKSNLYRQLVFYKLISELDSRFPYVVRKCELDFIKSKKKDFKKVSFEIPRQDIENLKKLIKEVMKKIRNLHF
ncbi:AAA family ATPase [Candidatus Dojkabacteria bacterium]|nr:AAA family ATPase [Candidatus Dojkabacteria bacterium]